MEQYIIYCKDYRFVDVIGFETTKLTKLEDFVHEPFSLSTSKLL